MNKTKLLLDVVYELRSLADSVQAVAGAIAGNEPVEAMQPEPPAPVPEPKPKPEVKPVTLEQVRSVLAEKSQDGFTAQVRGLLEKHGATKLSQINPSEFSTLLLEAEALK